VRAAAALGVRLAITTREQRGRTALVVLAAALSSAVLLIVLATTNSELDGSLRWQEGSETRRLVSAITVTTALPVVALAATVGRLSAILRDQRLASLRLLGMTPAQTRVVAASETTVAGVVGALLGVPFFYAIRPVLDGLDLGGAPRPVGALQPGLLGWLTALVGVPLAILAVATVPRRGDITSALDTARRRDLRRPAIWRVVPVVVGLAGCALLLITMDGYATDRDAWLFMAAATLTGVGLVLVLPVVVRLVGDLGVRLTRSPTGVLTARRLQAHPAGVSRMVAALMVGLFLIVGARAVVAAFESMDGYRAGVEMREKGQRLEITATPGQVERVRDEAAAAGARVEWVVPQVTVKVPEAGATGFDAAAVVATCADLRHIDPELRGCVDDKPMWVLAPASQSRADIPARATHSGKSVGKAVVLAAPRTALKGSFRLYDSGVQIVIPPSTPGLAALAKHTDRAVGVRGQPGVNLADSAGFSGYGMAGYDNPEDYELVLGLRRILWTVAAVIIGLGIAGYGVAVIDRAVNRRRELTSMRLAGVDTRTLRTAQFWEAFLPSVVGGALAVACGVAAGATWLALGGEQTIYPWRSIGGVTAAMVAGALLVALLTVATTSGRIRPEEIRQD
jgi:putative ABC transport system permease protein